MVYAPSTQTFYGNQPNDRPDAFNARGPNVHYFCTRRRSAVELEAERQSPINAEDLLAAYHATFRAAQGVTGQTSRPARVGLHRTMWPERVADVSAQVAGQLVREPREDLGDTHHIVLIFRETVQLVQDANQDLKQTSFVRTAAFDTQHKVLNLIGDSSIKQYAQLFAKFVIFAVRVHMAPPAFKCRSSFSPDDRKVAESIERVLRVIDSGNSDKLRAALLKLVSNLLFGASVAGGQNPDKFLLGWWLPLYFKRQGHFVSAIAMTSDMGHFDHTARLLLLYSANIQARKLDPSAPAAQLHGIAQHCTALMAAPTAYAHLIECRQIMSSEARDHLLVANVSWDDIEGHALRVQGTVFTVDAIKDTAQYLINRAWTRFVNELCFGLTWDRLAHDHPLEDDFSNHGVGYYFALNPANQFGDAGTILYNAIIGSPILRGKFQFGHELGTLKASPSRIRGYFGTADAFRLDLMAAIHLTYGGPARGTELASALFANTDTQVRDVRVIAGRLALTISYNKTNAITGTTNQVVRILPHCVSELVLQYLTIVRPFEIVLDRILYPADRHPLVLSHLFFANRALVPTAVFSDHLQKAFALFGVSGVNTSKYRHAFTAIARRHDIALGTEHDDLYDDKEDMLEEQSGHSATVARIHYARASGSYGSLDPNKVLLVNQLVVKWTKLIGVYDYQAVFEAERSPVAEPVQPHSRAFVPNPAFAAHLVRANDSPPCSTPWSMRQPQKSSTAPSSTPGTTPAWKSTADTAAAAKPEPFNPGSSSVAPEAKQVDRDHQHSDVASALENVQINTPAVALTPSKRRAMGDVILSDAKRRAVSSASDPPTSPTRLLQVSSRHRSEQLQALVLAPSSPQDTKPPLSMLATARRSHPLPPLRNRPAARPAAVHSGTDVFDDVIVISDSSDVGDDSPVLSPADHLPEEHEFWHTDDSTDTESSDDGYQPTFRSSVTEATEDGLLAESDFGDDLQGELLDLAEEAATGLDQSPPRVKQEPTYAPEPSMTSQRRLEAHDESSEEEEELEEPLPLRRRPSSVSVLGRAPRSSSVSHSKNPPAGPMSSVPPAMAVAPDLVVSYSKAARRFEYTVSPTPHQLVVMHLIAEATGDLPLTIIMPTGSGKTLPYAAQYYLLDGPLITIILSPLVQLTENLCARFKSGNVPASRWQKGVSVLKGFLVVAMEACADPAFWVWVEANLHSIARVVVEEAHVPLASSGFRPQLLQIGKLRSKTIDKPWVLLTATAPPKNVPLILNSLGLSQSLVMRLPTLSPGHRFAVYPEEFDGIDKALDPLVELVRHLQAHWCSPEGQILIFPFSRANVEAVGTRLTESGIPNVQASSPSPEWTPTEEQALAQRLASFYDGSVPVCVATSFIGVGVDILNVQVVIHVANPEDATDYVQQVGRCGRTEVGRQKALSILMTCDTQMRAKLRHDTGRTHMSHMSSQGCLCRRLPLSEYLDGVAVDCASAGASPCDLCESATTNRMPAYFPPNIDYEPNVRHQPLKAVHHPKATLTTVAQQNLQDYLVTNAATQASPSVAAPLPTPTVTQTRTATVRSYSTPLTNARHITAPSSMRPRLPPMPGPRRSGDASNPLLPTHTPPSHSRLSQPPATHMSPPSSIMSQNHQAAESSNGPSATSGLSLRDQLIILLRRLRLDGEEEMRKRGELSVERQNLIEARSRGRIQQQCEAFLPPLLARECVLCLVWSLLPGAATGDSQHHEPQHCPRLPYGWWKQLKPWKTQIQAMICVHGDHCSACFVPWNPSNPRWHNEQVPRIGRRGFESFGCVIGADNDRQYHALALIILDRLPDPRTHQLQPSPEEWQQNLSSIGRSGLLVAAEAMAWLHHRRIPTPEWCVRW